MNEKEFKELLQTIQDLDNDDDKKQFIENYLIDLKAKILQIKGIQKRIGYIVYENILSNLADNLYTVNKNLDKNELLKKEYELFAEYENKIIECNDLIKTSNKNKEISRFNIQVLKKTL